MTVVEAGGLSGLRFLVVEDEYMVAEHIRTLLDDLGCEVVGPVATIEEALALLQDGRLDGALLDANLDGDSTAPIAAALDAAAVPFIVATGYGARDLGDDALNAAPRIAKPFGKMQLTATLVAAFVNAPRAR